MIERAYAYPTSKVQLNGAIFMNIENLSNTQETVISAYTDIADRVELHTHIMDGDIMMMRQVEGYVIPAKQHVKLEPTGHHIMLFGLKNPLKVGDTFPLYLKVDGPNGQTTEHGQYVVDVTVGYEPTAVSTHGQMP